MIDYQAYLNAVGILSECDFKKVLYSISKKEIEDIIKDNEPINVECHFCNTSYKFDIDELKGIL